MHHQEQILRIKYSSYPCIAVQAARRRRLSVDRMPCWFASKRQTRQSGIILI